MYLKAAIVAVVAVGISSAQAPAGVVRPAGTRSGCRVWPTSATQVTVSPIARTEVISTTQYDASNSQAVTNGVMTDNRGTRVTMKTVTQYESTADAVHEVVRASGPHGATAKGSQVFSALAGSFESSDVGHGLFLASAFSENYRTVDRFTSSSSIAASGAGALDSSSTVAWAVTTIPPLRLFKTVTITGDLKSTTTNSFDQAGRLLRTVATDATGQNATTASYTAWDQFGRPTTGTQEGPGFRQTVEIMRDDVARTETATFRTSVTGAAGTTAVVYKSTFDVNGNMVLQETRSPAGTSTTTVTISSLGTVCTGPLHPPR